MVLTFKEDDKAAQDRPIERPSRRNWKTIHKGARERGEHPEQNRSASTREKFDMAIFFTSKNGDHQKASSSGAVLFSFILF